ncbi:MAG: hypothetical protein VX494_16720 [Actinomycetota bacterium]|nr:hypothetical protein [Actinomycetota bacterium]MEE3128847.1 hypothetical protein [Actinomycetota bacterium]
MKLSPLARLTPLALAVGLSLTACGSDDSSDAAAQDASAQEGGSSLVAEGDDFCTALMATASVQDGEDVAALRDSLEEAGLPEGAGEDAQAGLEVYLDVLDQVDEDATAKDLESMEDPGLSKAEQADVDAMVSYATTTCAGGAGQDSETPESETPQE